MKKTVFRIMCTLILICCMVNFMSISGYCENNKKLDYQFCYGYFETSDEEINGYRKLMVHKDTVYISIEDFLSLSNISDIKIKCTQIEYDDLSDELKNEIAYSKNVYAVYKELVDLNCWTFSTSSNKAYCTSYYKGVTNVDLGGEVISLGENSSDIYIPFQALFSIFDVPYNIEENTIEVYEPVYTPTDYMHMEHLNHYRYNVTSDDITSGKIGMFIDYMDDGLSIISDFDFFAIDDFIGQTSGELPDEESCEELTKMLCQVDETEKSKLLEYSDLTLNLFLPFISNISDKLFAEGINTENKDIEDFLKLLTDYCNNNPTINVNGNEIESKYLLNFVLNTEIGDKYAQAVKSGDISESVNNVFSISGKILEKYIAWASVSQTATNENIINAVHTYCENFITTGELSNTTKFKNYILDYTFYDDKELVYDVNAVPLESIDKDMIFNGNNSPHKRGLSNQIVTYINENSDKYIDEEKQKEYGYKLFVDGIIELFKDKSFDKITNLKFLKNIKAIKNTANMKSAFGILNAEWNILKLFSNEANGTFDFYKANKMLLYANGLEQDTTNAVKAIKSNLSSNNYTSQIGNENKQISESKHWEDYCDLEYVRLKSYYIAHSLVKTKNEQYVKLINSLREQELHSYTDDVPKYIRISSEEEYNEKINIYNDLIERENLILDELSDYMVMILNAKQNLDSIKSISYSKEADTELINICCQKVTGTVKDSDGKAIDDVVVNFKKGTDTYFVKSNEFPVYLKAGDYEVSVSDDRYEEYTSKIVLDKFTSVSIDIVLTKSENNYTWHLDPTIKQNIEVTQINKTGEVNISDGYLNVRESPSQSGKVIGKLYDGDTVKITGKFNDWYEIEFDGKNGYVFKDLIKIVDKNVSTKPSETYKDESTDLVDFQTTDGLYIGINNVFITGVYTDEINSYGFDIYNYDNLLLYDNKFYQMYNNQYISGETYSGKYEVDENNQLILSYKNAMRSSFNIGNGTHYLSYDIFYEIKDYFDLKDNIYNNSKITYDEYLKDANDNKYIFDTKVSMFNLYDEIKYMPSPYCYHIDKKQNNTGWKEVSDNKIYNIKGYFKDGYDKDEFIVAEQKGYTIDNMNNSNDFVLKYDNSKLSANKCNVVITFKNGYYETSSTCKEYDGYKGKYEFFSRNLIKIHAPENYKNNEQVYNFLYLDFEKKQVYLPLYYKYLSNESEIKSTYEELEDRITKKLLD